MVRVLIVEDDKDIADAICRDLKKESTEYETELAESAEQVLLRTVRQYDVILLDIMLPGMDGIELCTQLRKAHHCPILFVSCLDDSDTIIRALGQGGDDYICKPFDSSVLHARIQANLRRAGRERILGKKHYCYEEYELDSDTHTLFVDGKGISLLPIEFRIFSLLLEHPGEFFKGREIYEKIWGQDSFGDTRTVIVHIHNLRRKIGDDGENPRIIRNERGRGYTFSP